MGAENWRNSAEERSKSDDGTQEQREGRHVSILATSMANMGVMKVIWFHRR